MDNNLKNNTIKNSWWVFREIYNTNKFYIIFNLIAVIIGGIIPSISLIIMQNIINFIQIGEFSNLIFYYIAIYMIIDILESFYNNFMNYYSTRFSMKFILNLSTKIFYKASKLSLTDYENSKTYDLINRAQFEGGDKLLQFFSAIISIFQNIITLLSYLFILFYFRIWIVLVVLIVPIINYKVSNYFNLKRFIVLRERTNDSRKSWYLSYILTYGSFYKELRTFNLFGYFIDRYKSYIKRFNKKDLSIYKNQMFIYCFVSLFENVLDGLLFLYIIILGISKVILIGNVITYTRTIISSKSLIGSIFSGVSSLINESLFINQLFEFLNLEEENRGEVSISRINSIVINNLSYRYRASDDYVLKDISFSIKDNEKIALLGVNGSGKTTLIKLIMGFYNDYEGSILINGVEVRDINKSDLLNQISTLFQDFVKYEASFRENIGYGNLDLLYNDNFLEEVSKKFGVYNLVSSYNERFEKQLGLWFDSGVDLSIGQWQKIALCRAFYKNSSLYILDEPNASMDSITEYDISLLYKELLKDSMGIIIAHKFNNIVKMVDKIIVLDNGKIIECGTNDELIYSNGIYKKMYDLR